METSLHSRNLEFSFFIFGVLFFLVVRLMFFGPMILDRQAPVEIDDSYGYILKAAQFDSCFKQKCPALVDLRKQFSTPSNQSAVADARYREYHRVLFQYHPLHSLILYAVHSTGLSWEQAYKSVQFTGIFLLGLSIAYFLYAFWGGGAAGLALIILSVTLFRGNGLHTAVPSNLALGIALTSWALLKQDIKKPALVIFLVLAMLAMHPIGRLYAIITVCLYILWTRYRKSREFMVTVFVSATAILFAFIAGYFISNPALSISPYSGWASSQQSILTAVIGNLGIAYEIFQGWINNFGGRIGAALLITVGFVLLPGKERIRALLFILLLAFFIAASMFHNYPNYFGVLFKRIWIPFALMLYGAVGYTGWKLSLWAIESLCKNLNKSSVGFYHKKYILTPRGWMLSLSGALSILLIFSIAGMSFNGYRSVRDYTQTVKNRNDLTFSPEQPLKLLKLANAGDAVLYDSEAILYYYLINGALSLNTVYLPAVSTTPLEKEWITDNNSLRYAVLSNPIKSGSLSLVGNGKIEIKSGLPLDKLAFYIVNPNDTAQKIRLSAAGAKNKDAGDAIISVPAGHDGWIKTGWSSGRAADRLVLNAVGNLPLRLRGIRMGSGQKSYWPWDQGITIRRGTGDNNETARDTINFDTKSIAPVPGRNILIIDDAGASVLLKFVS